MVIMCGKAYKRNKKIVLERQAKMYLRNKLRLTYHYIWNYYPITLLLSFDNFDVVKKCKRNTLIHYMGLNPGGAYIQNNIFVRK